MVQESNSPLIDPNIIAGKSVIAQEAKTKKQTPDKGGFIWGVGRRKSSVARVRIKPGKGSIVINEKEFKEYFSLIKDQEAVLAPMNACDVNGKFDVFINVQGGGTTGQAGAALLGIARALSNYDEVYLRPLRDAGHLTRDGRMKERKKPGQKAARRRFQFSKR